MLAGYHWWQYGQALWEALYSLLMNPLFYVAILLLLWDSFRRVRHQRGFFGFRTNGIWQPLFSLMGLSLLVGLYLSIANLLIGIIIRPEEIWIVSALMLLLGLIRVRYAASIYAIGLLLLISFLVQQSTIVTGVVPIDWLLTVLRHTSIFSWLVLGGGLMLGEWFFFLLRRSGQAGPALRGSRRGRAIGAVFVQNSVLMPVAALQPGQIHIAPHLLWAWPLGSHLIHSFSLVALPVLFGFSGLYASMRPEQVVRIYRRYVLLLGVLLAVDAYFVYRYSAAFVLVGIGLLLVIRELADWHLNHRETESDSIYPVSQEGVRILGVVPESVAAAMALKPGEVISRINQIPVHTAYDFHFALDQNPAYAKLEVIDANGEIRIVGKPVYSGERNKLGLILLPDLEARKAYRPIRIGWLQTMYLKSASSPDARMPSWKEPESVSIPD